MPENDRPIQSEKDRAEVRRRPPPQPEPLVLALLYEDDYLIAIDKPSGMVVHPTYRNWSGTLLNGLLWHLRGRTRAAPRIVTRLDKGTSGLVLVALTSEIHAQIQRDSARRLVKKEYLAIVDGTPEPPRGSIALPLARSAIDRRRVVVDPVRSGKPHRLRGPQQLERPIRRAVRPGDRPHPSDSRAPGGAWMAGARRCRLRCRSRSYVAPGTARVAIDDDASCHATGSRTDRAATR